MPWGNESVEANIGLIVFLLLCSAGYLTIISSSIHRIFHPRPTPRIIPPHEVEPRLSTLIEMGLPENIADPIARGDKINAIIAYRETYGVDLKRAKDGVEAWQSALRAVEPTRQPDR